MPCRLGEDTFTVTPGSGRPWLSVTRPEMAPVVVCAAAVAVTAIMATAIVATRVSHVRSVRMRFFLLYGKSRRLLSERHAIALAIDLDATSTSPARCAIVRARTLMRIAQNPNGEIHAIQPIE